MDVEETVAFLHFTLFEFILVEATQNLQKVQECEWMLKLERINRFSISYHFTSTQATCSTDVL